MLSGARFCMLLRFSSKGCVSAKLRPLEMLGLKRLNRLLSDRRVPESPTLKDWPQGNNWLALIWAWSLRLLSVSAPATWV